MKTKHFLTISLLCAFVFSCTKPETQIENDHPSKSLSTSAWTTYIDGIVVTSDSFVNDTTSLYSFADCSTYSIYNFTSEEKYLNWAGSQSYKDKNGSDINLIEFHNRLNYLAEYAVENGIVETYETTGIIPDSYVELATSYQVTSDNNQDNPPCRKLYRNTGFLGSYHFSLIIPIPSLGSHRNDTESLFQIFLGVQAYCDKTFFRGKRFYFLTFPYGGVPDLSVVGWSNRFESISPY